jgi:two-component system NtrC family sensor kinase
MQGLRKKLITVAILASIFLVMQLAVYLITINEFRVDQKTLEDIDSFMENVLELRRYETTFSYEITQKDIDEIMQYTTILKTGMQDIRKSPVASSYDDGLQTFTNNLTAYDKLVLKARAKGGAEPEAIRIYGHKMRVFSRKVRDINRAYIAERLKSIMYIPSTIMFLFGGSLIVALVSLTMATIKQINFIKQTTHRIAQGDFRHIDHSSAGYKSYPMIIRAFNRMIGELDSRQEQLIQSKKLAAIGTLTSGIAHEVNNPLNNISLTAEAILEERDDLSREEETEMLNDIVSEVSRASKVVNNLLDFSRIHGEITLEPNDIGDLVKQTLRLIRNQIMLSGVQLKTSLPRERLCINGDSDSIKQVFVNLCLNAIQAMPDGGLLSISIHAEDEQVIVVKVADTGTGMPPEVVDKIFDPFFTTKPVGKGTGLGLSVVYGIVNKHEGYIEVNSNAGQGTTFTVAFPRRPLTEKPESCS